MSRFAKYDKGGDPGEQPQPHRYTPIDLGWGLTEEPTTTRCKHGKGSCEECGTNDETDAIHTTVGGRGVVGRIRR